MAGGPVRARSCHWPFRTCGTDVASPQSMTPVVGVREGAMTNREAQEGVNRRHLFQTLAAGAAVSGVIGSPALARQPPAAVLTVASAEDYALNPTRWGSAEIAALFPGFHHL